VAGDNRVYNRGVRREGRCRRGDDKSRGQEERKADYRMELGKHERTNTG
jgi:hypothetical protein